MRGLWDLLEEPAGWVLVLEYSEVLKKKLITMWDLRWGQTFGDRIQWFNYGNLVIPHRNFRKLNKIGVCPDPIVPWCQAPHIYPEYEPGSKISPSDVRSPLIPTQPIP